VNEMGWVSRHLKEWWHRHCSEALILNSPATWSPRRYIPRKETGIKDSVLVPYRDDAQTTIL
jgi:hypothetical protein